MSRTRPSRFWETLAVVIVKPLSWLLVKKDWRRGDRMPRTGGVIIATNHLSWADPVLLAHFLYNHGRWPVVLAKSTLFKVPFLGHAVRELCAIPVDRGSDEAARSLGSRPSACAKAARSCSIPRAPARVTPGCGRWWARPAPPGWRWRAARR